MVDKSGWAGTVVGLAVLGAALTGVLGLVAAVMAILSSDWAAAGACLIAAGLSFGLLAGAILRD